MQFISLILLLIGIMLITISYTKEKTSKMDNKVEYRYIPQWLYDEQFGHIDLQKKYEDIFMKSNPSKTSILVKQIPDTEFILTEFLTATASNQPQRRDLPVVAPNSCPCLLKYSPVSSNSSVGNGPEPTLVV